MKRQPAKETVPEESEENSMESAIPELEDPKVERKQKLKKGVKKVKDLLVQLLAGSIVKDIGDAADKAFTSKEERQQALNDAEEIYNERLKIIYQLTNQDADSWLSKNVRPLCQLIALGTLSMILIFKIPVDEKLLESYGKWTGIMISFYFGIREVVKYVNRKNS